MKIMAAKSTLGLAAVAVILAGFAGSATANSVGFSKAVAKAEFGRGNGDGSGGGNGNGGGGGNGNGGGNQKFKKKQVAPGNEPQVFNPANPQKFKVIENAPVIVEKAPALKLKNNAGARVIIEGSGPEQNGAEAFVSPDPAGGETQIQVEIQADQANGMADGTVLDADGLAALGMDVKQIPGYTGHEQIIVKLIEVPVVVAPVEHKNSYKPQTYHASGYTENETPVYTPKYTPSYTYEKPVYHQSYDNQSYSYDHNAYENTDNCQPSY